MEEIYEEEEEDQGYTIECGVNEKSRRKDMSEAMKKLKESGDENKIKLAKRLATVSDKKSWDTLTKRCVFPSRAPLVPLKVVYRGLVTKSCTPTLRGQGDPKVSQPF